MLKDSKILDLRSTIAYHRQRLKGAVSIPLNSLSDRWFELPNKQTSLIIMLPKLLGQVDCTEWKEPICIHNVLSHIKLRGWNITSIFVDDTDEVVINCLHQPSIPNPIVYTWKEAKEWHLIDDMPPPNPMPFLFSPSSFLEEQISRIESTLTNSNYWMCDIGCGSGRDLAWILARNSYWSVCGVDDWYGALERTSQLLNSRQFPSNRARLIRAQFKSNGELLFKEFKGRSDYFVTNKEEAYQRLMIHQYDLVIVIRFLERASFPLIDHLVRPGGYLLYCTFVDGISDYKYPIGKEHRLTLGELSNYFGSNRHYIILEDKIIWTEDHRPLCAFLARKHINL